MSQARYNFDMFVAGSCIYAVGGEFDDEDEDEDEENIIRYLASMKKYEAESDRWSAACSMAGPRSAFQTCVLTTQENVFDAMMRRALHILQVWCRALIYVSGAELCLLACR